MRIGEFADICDTKISVLRHYDKEGLLIPDFIDNFTGYRYYSAEQLTVFNKITVLKDAGFTLKEIKYILQRENSTEIVLDSIRRKKSELTRLLSNLEHVKNIMLGVNDMENVILVSNNEQKLEMRMLISNPVTNFMDSCRRLEEEGIQRDYQRISGFKTYGAKDASELWLAMEVVKLHEEVKPVNEELTMSFEADDVVGKWEVVGEYLVKEDFFRGDKFHSGNYGDVKKSIYFLPGGENYWCYGWTKGYLIMNSGDGSSYNSYKIEGHDNERYMFVQNKSYYYRRGGVATILVLRQIDQKEYSSKEIARYDVIDKPFVLEQDVLGKWISVAYIRTREEFNPSYNEENNNLYFKGIEFFEDGNCSSIYGEQIISGQDMQTWTKGFVLRKWNRTACAYELVVDNDKDYLIVEWKSGDYLWGGYDTDYYVLMREKDISL